MARRRVCVIGGGPAGLFVARLLALRHPDWGVVLHERLPPDDTFGFGVGLTENLLRALRDADPEVHHSLLEQIVPYVGAEFRLPRGRAVLPQFHAGAIGRARMLRRLLELAVSAGVEARIGSSVTVEEAQAEADLVIAADGLSSLTRAHLRAELGATEEIGRGLFIWCGSQVRLTGTVFQPVETADGAFVAHAYPYADGLSTIVIEADEESLRRAGCSSGLSELEDEADSDERALEYLTAAFAELLQGTPLIGNRSRWMRFRAVHCARWHHENVVLLGDAKATAHPSLGSGTKLALEDAIALSRTLESIGEHPLAARLQDFERARRPAVERLQERARRSQLWWESFPSRLHLTPSRTAVAYLSRAGAVSLDEVFTSAPALAAAASSEWADVDVKDVPDHHLSRWVLNHPISVNGRLIPTRRIECPEARLTVACPDPWGPEAQRLVEAAGRLARSGAEIIALCGERSRSALLDRLALGERIRAEVDALVAVEADEQHLTDAADGLVAGRTDLVIALDADDLSG